MIYYFPESKFSAKHVGKNLMKLLEVNSSPIEIAKWSYNIFHHYNNNITGDIRKKFMSLMFMEEGPEFELSKEELLKIAGELMESEDNNL